MLKKIDPKKLLIIVIALAIAIFSTITLKHSLEKNRPTEQVLVAKNDIMPSTIVTTNDLGYATLPVGSRLSETIQDPKQIVGKKTTTTIYKNEQIIPQKLTDSKMALGPEESKVSAPIDAVRAVGLTIKPGTIVDVYWLQEQQKESMTNVQATIKQAQLISDRATVLDVINKNNISTFNIAATQTEDKTKSNNNSGNTPAVVVLKIKNSESQTFATAVGNGTIYLVGRGE